MGDIGDPSTGTGLAVLGVTVGLVVLAVAMGLAALLLAARGRRAARDDLAAARAESAELRARLDELERSRPESAPVLTSEPIGRPHDDAGDEPVTVTATLPAPVFTDMVVRESVIRLASLSHGVRRALSAEQRHRIRFEVRREVKRSRRQRRTDAKAALREQQRVERAREDAA